MMKEFFIAIAMTLVFSVGVGVLFVRTILDMLEILLDEEIEAPELQPSRHKEG